MNACIAKIWTLRDGIGLAVVNNVIDLHIELDVYAVIQALNSNESHNLILELLLVECRNLLEAMQAYRIEHIYREANGCSDALARLGKEQRMQYTVFTSIPDALARLEVNKWNLQHHEQRLGREASKVIGILTQVILSSEDNNNHRSLGKGR